MENNKQKKHLFNLFDVIIIGAVLLAAALVLVLKMGSSSDGETVVVETRTVRYAVELTDLYPGTADAINIGDVLVDNIKKYEVGKIVDLEVYPTEKLSKDLETGTYHLVQVPERESVLITLEAECTENDRQILAGGGFEVRGGEGVSLKGPGYTGSGYIYWVERGEAE